MAVFLYNPSWASAIQHGWDFEPPVSHRFNLPRFFETIITDTELGKLFQREHLGAIQKLTLSIDAHNSKYS